MTVVENFDLFINGKWVSSSEPRIPIVNPANEEILCTVAQATSAHVDLAAKAAREALHLWKFKSIEERSKILNDMSMVIEKHKNEIACLESKNNGKPLKEATFDMNECIMCLQYFAGWVTKLYGKTLQVTPGKYSTQTRLEPMGVCGLIVPWNYPLLMAMWKIAPALACGNTIIIKPSEVTPLSLLFVCRLFSEAGLPNGVINVVNGPGDTVGNAICTHPNIDKVSFTGSTRVGHLILRHIAENNLKRTTLELGGKSPMIVFEDADLDKAANDVIDAAFCNAGQNCCAGTKLFLQRSIHTAFLNKLQELVGKLVVGNPMDDHVNMGPVVSKVHFEKVMKFIEDARKLQLKCIHGGNRIGRCGFFIEPTIFADVPDDSRLALEEIFGPVLCILQPFDTVDEVIQRANIGKYGLAGGVWTSNIHIAEKIVTNLDVGMVWVNCYNHTPVYVPFGGFKESGYGKDLGEETLHEYTRIKSVMYCYE